MGDNHLKRVQKRFRLKIETLEYLEEYAYENNIPYKSISTAIDKIVDEYRERNNNEFKLNYVVDQISNAVTQSINSTLNKELNRIRLGTNNTDRNTQILIELLQGLMQSYNINHIISTDDNVPPFLKETNELIKNRITVQKQKKDSKLK